MKTIIVSTVLKASENRIIVLDRHRTFSYSGTKEKLYSAGYDPLNAFVQYEGLNITVKYTFANSLEDLEIFVSQQKFKTQSGLLGIRKISDIDISDKRDLLTEYTLKNKNSEFNLSTLFLNKIGKFFMIEISS